VSAEVSPRPNATDDWWNGVENEEVISFRFDGSEGGLFSGVFVPPPPRPFNLDDSATPDGLTTCDLCSWAWKQGNTFATDASLELPDQIGWVFSLVVVSIISAFVGAIIMIIVLHCRRLKSTSDSGTNRTISGEITRDISLRPPIDTPNDKEHISTIAPPNFPSLANISNNSVWCWLSKRSSSGPSQLDNIACSPAENHYTHMEESYNVGEALYAELDVESNSTNPAYQNSAYTDPDAQISSAPSSAYYSDLSVTPGPERAYEVVNLVTMTNWDNGINDRRSISARLAAISENVTVPSDYI
ncbi:hypothetical protein HHI36_020059, partial [Cryptolaemus montrouzieri]